MVVHCPVVGERVHPVHDRMHLKRVCRSSLTGRQENAAPRQTSSRCGVRPMATSTESSGSSGATGSTAIAKSGKGNRRVQVSSFGSNHPRFCPERVDFGSFPFDRISTDLHDDTPLDPGVLMAG